MILNLRENPQGFLRPFMTHMSQIIAHASVHEQSCSCPSTHNDSGSGSPTLGQAHQHLRNLWALFLINSRLTGCLSNAGSLPSCSPEHVLLVSEGWGRSRPNHLGPVAHLALRREAGCPAPRMTRWHKGVQTWRDIGRDG